MTTPAATESPPSVDVRRTDDDTITVAIGGTWRLRGPIPRVQEVRAILRSPGPVAPTRIVVDAAALESWDSSLFIFMMKLRELAESSGATCSWGALPEQGKELLGKCPVEAKLAPVPRPVRKWFMTRLGEQTNLALAGIHAHLRFYGECVQAIFRVVFNPFSFRWGDGFDQMRRCGAAALPIVGLISVLVGVILAFVAAVQLRQFGADIFVADLVGLAVFREMGPMMAAIVLTGRTGAAFAAELGNMVLGEEVDALETFGVRPVDFLVAPRLLALLAMMPLLAIYADFLGVVGGAFIASIVLDIAPPAFFSELQTAVGLTDIGTGLIKSVVFGWIVAYSGCYRGMRSGRSAVAVGESTTGAVVMGILFIIIADAVFTVIYNFLGW